MEGYFGNNSNFDHTVPPLNLPSDNISPFTSPRDCDPIARVRDRDESVILRYLLSGSSPPDENVTPENRPAAIINNQLRRLSSGSARGYLSPRGSPLSSLENVECSPLSRSQLASTAVKMEEDVLVVDAIPIRSVVRPGGGSGSVRMRSLLPLPSDSGGLSSSSSLTGHSGLYKKEICRSWEDFGTCRYGAKCMFAHGKEEIHPRILNKSKSEMNLCKSPSNAGTLTYGQRNRSSDKALTRSNIKEKGSFLVSRVSMNPTEEQQQNQEGSPSTKARDWSPLDDGIKITLPCPFENPPSREAVDEYLDGILYGPWPSDKMRLPVFKEICPD